MHNKGKAPACKFCKFRNLFANSESENYSAVPRIQAVTVVPIFCLNVALKVL